MALVAVSDPDVAVMVALPFATDVTSPADDMVATAASGVVQAIVCPLIVAEF
jgi:hypothetical protein